MRVARLVIQDGATFSGKVSMGPQAAEAAMAPPPELEAEPAPEMQTGPAAATDGKDKPASGKGKREVEKLLAKLFPEAERPASVRPIRSPEEVARPEATSTRFAPETQAPVPAEAASASSRPVPHDSAQGGPGLDVRPSTAAEPALAAVAHPMSALRDEIRFAASAETHDRLRRAQDLPGHAVPSGDLGQVFDRALALLVTDLEKKTFGATSRPQKGRGH